MWPLKSKRAPRSPSDLALRSIERILGRADISREEKVAALAEESRGLKEIRDRIRPAAEWANHPGWVLIRNELIKRIEKLALLEHASIGTDPAKATVIHDRINSYSDVLRIVDGFDKEYVKVEGLLNQKLGDLMRHLRGEPSEENMT